MARVSGQGSLGCSVLSLPNCAAEASGNVPPGPGEANLRRQSVIKIHPGLHDKQTGSGRGAGSLDERVRKIISGIDFLLDPRRVEGEINEQESASATIHNLYSWSIMRFLSLSTEEK